jgi:hypothetical protein
MHKYILGVYEYVFTDVCINTYWCMHKYILGVYEYLFTDVCINTYW